MTFAVLWSMVYVLCSMVYSYSCAFCRIEHKKFESSIRPLFLTLMESGVQVQYAETKHENKQE